MFDMTREMLAYSIIGVMVMLSVPWTALVLRRQYRRRLRMRGIKSYGQ